MLLIVYVGFVLRSVHMLAALWVCKPLVFRLGNRWEVPFCRGRFGYEEPQQVVNLHRCGLGQVSGDDKRDRGVSRDKEARKGGKEISDSRTTSAKTYVEDASAVPWC